jgi:streptogramin lyase
MGKKQISRLIIFSAALVIAAFAVAPAAAEILSWRSYTSFNQVTDMIQYNGFIWVATTGGLVRIDPATMQHETFTNVDGLGTNVLYCLRVDSRCRLWVGGKGHLVNFTDPDRPDGYLFTDRDGDLVEIYDIDCSPDGDSLWLADRLGLTIFLASAESGRGLILDTYSRFGDIVRDTPARKVALSSDSIWVGTDGGLAIGSRFDIRQLKAPTGWINYFPSQISTVPSDSIRALVVRNDSIFIGVTQGFYRLDREAGPVLMNLNLYGNPIIYNISLVGDSILTNSVRGSAFYYNGNFDYQPTAGMPISNTTAGAVDDLGAYWDGNLFYGIYRRSDGSMVGYDAGGTPRNECEAIAATQGKIWGAFAGEILAYLDGDTWTPVAGVIGRLTSLEVGPLGELWVGTFGNGVYRILGDSIAHFDSDNSPLRGPYNAQTFVVVSDICSTDDAVWFANFVGAGGELAAVNPYNTEQWQAYVFTGGPNAERIVTVAAAQDLVYAGSEENGIFQTDDRGSPFDTLDDATRHFTTDNSGIGSNFIHSLEIDEYDTLWVGTSYGLSYQSVGEIYFTNMDVPAGFGPEVTALAFDAQGSLLAGSPRGLAIRDIATGTFQFFNAKNSGLTDDDIIDIYYQKDADAAWISTTGGISRLTMPYRMAARDLDEIRAYPNPLVIRYGTETVRFDYAGLAEVRIFTLAGELVREISVNGVWDGRNADGKLVASGVYIFTLTTPDGDSGRGKILLIRE